MYYTELRSTIRGFIKTSKKCHGPNVYIITPEQTKHVSSLSKHVTVNGTDICRIEVNKQFGIYVQYGPNQHADLGASLSQFRITWLHSLTYRLCGFASWIWAEMSAFARMHSSYAMRHISLYSWATSVASDQTSQTWRPIGNHTFWKLFWHQSLPPLHPKRKHEPTCGSHDHRWI